MAAMSLTSRLSSSTTKVRTPAANVAGISSCSRTSLDTSALLLDSVSWAYSRLLLRLAEDFTRGALTLTRPENYYRLWPNKKEIISGGGTVDPCAGWDNP